MLLLTLAACFSKPPRPGEGDAALPGDGPAGTGWLTGFAFRKQVTITSGLTEVTLPDFPVAIAIADPDITSHAASQGRDIVVTEADGETPLASEVAAFDKSSDTIEVWVRIPVLGPTATVFVYYGGAQQTPTTAVWDGPVFAGVWHLSESGTARDSTRQGNHLDGVGGAVPMPFADGVFGGARELDGNDQMTGGDPIDGSLDFGMASFSYSLWVHQTQLGTPPSFDTPFYKGGTSNGEPGYCWLLGSAGWTAKVTDNANHTADPEVGTAVALMNQWVHIAAVVDRTNGVLATYANGIPQGSQSLSGMMIGDLSTAEPIQLGRGTIEPFRGRLDELRIYKTAVTRDWLATEFRNGTDPSFLAVGPEQTQP